MQTCSLVQVGLQSSGYHTSTTFFLPAKSESLTSFLSWFGKVKSGAFCPTAMLIFVPPVNLKFRLASYRICCAPTNRGHVRGQARKPNTEKAGWSEGNHSPRPPVV